MTRDATTDEPRLDLSFVRRAGRTVIERRMFAWPFVLTRSFHVDPDRPGRLSVIVQTASGAVHGEDCLTQRFVLHPGTDVCLTNQGATSVHRADPAVLATETVKLHVSSGSTLEYLPEPRIMFPDAALRQCIELDCADDASALVVDAFTMHDPGGHARGFRELESVFRLRRSAREPLMVDRSRLYRPQDAIFRGYRAFGSAYLVRPSPHDLAGTQAALMVALDEISGLYAAASVMPASSGLGVRLAALDLRSLRAAVEIIKRAHRRTCASAAW